MLTHGSRLLWGWATSTSELAPHLHRDFAHTCTRRLPHTDDGAHFASANPPLHNRHSPCMPAADASSNTVRSGQYDSSAAVRQKLDGIVRARAGCAEPDGRGHDAFREGAIRKDAEKRSGAASEASSGLGINGAWTGTRRCVTPAPVPGLRGRTRGRACEARRRGESSGSERRTARIGVGLLERKLSNLCKTRALFSISATSGTCLPTAALPRRSAQRPLGRESSPAARPSRANSVAWNRTVPLTSPLTYVGDPWSCGLRVLQTKKSIRQFQRSLGR